MQISHWMWLLASVGPHVGGEVAGSGQINPCLADLALVRPLAGVGPHVLENEVC